MFFQKICVVNPYRVLRLKPSRILTRLFRSSQRRQGLSNFGQGVFVMTFPKPLLTSHVHPQDFVGLTTNCAVNGIWYCILQQSPIGKYVNVIAPPHPTPPHPLRHVDIFNVAWRASARAVASHHRSAQVSEPYCSTPPHPTPHPPQFCGPVKDPLACFCLCLYIYIHVYI